MLDAVTLATRAHLTYEQDITHIQRETLKEKHYYATDPAESADLRVAIADNRTTQDDLRIAYAIANGWDTTDLDRNGFRADFRLVDSNGARVGYRWSDITPTVAEQAIAYATDEQLARDGYLEHIA